MPEPTGGPPGSKGFWPDWLTPRRIWEYSLRIARIQNNVDALQRDMAFMKTEIRDLRETQITQEAQLKVLTAFVRDSLSNRLEAKIDKLAAEIVARKSKD